MTFLILHATPDLFKHSYVPQNKPKLANDVFLSPLSRVSVLPCLSRIPVQRPWAGDGGGPGPGSAAAAARGGGCQLLLPASLWPADVHHAHALQQENNYQWQGQRHGGGQGCLPVSVLLCGNIPVFSN